MHERAASPHPGAFVKTALLRSGMTTASSRLRWIAALQPREDIDAVRQLAPNEGSTVYPLGRPTSAMRHLGSPARP